MSKCCRNTGAAAGGGAGGRWHRPRAAAPGAAAGAGAGSTAGRRRTRPAAPPPPGRPGAPAPAPGRRCGPGAAAVRRSHLAGDRATKQVCSAQPGLGGPGGAGQVAHRHHGQRRDQPAVAGAALLPVVGDREVHGVVADAAARDQCGKGVQGDHARTLQMGAAIIPAAPRWHDARSRSTPAMDQRVSQTLSPNPLLQDWDTPHGLPPFDAIRTEHFVPALRAAMQANRDELDAIAAQAEAAQLRQHHRRLRPLCAPAGAHRVGVLQPGVVADLARAAGGAARDGGAAVGALQRGVHACRAVRSASMRCMRSANRWR